MAFCLTATAGSCCQTTVASLVAMIVGKMGKNVNFKCLRLVELIIPKWKWKLDLVCRFQTWNFIWWFLYWVMFSVKYFLIRDNEDALNLTYLMAWWENNPIQPCLLRFLRVIKCTWSRCHMQINDLYWD